jgi:hypothetical protein
MSINSLSDNPAILASLNIGVSQWIPIPIPYNQFAFTTAGSNNPVTANGTFALFNNGNTYRLVCYTFPATTVNTFTNSILYQLEAGDITLNINPVPDESLIIPSEYLPPQGIFFTFPCSVRPEGHEYGTGICYMSAVPVIQGGVEDGTVRLQFNSSEAIGLNTVVQVEFQNMFEWTLDPEPAAPAPPLLLANRVIEEQEQEHVPLQFHSIPGYPQSRVN